MSGVRNTVKNTRIGRCNEKREEASFNCPLQDLYQQQMNENQEKEGCGIVKNVSREVRSFTLTVQTYATIALVTAAE